MEIQKFETVIIFTGQLSKSEYDEKVDEYREILKGLPASEIKTIKKEQASKLAYELRNNSYGWCVTFYCKSTRDLMNTKLDLRLRQDNEVIKFITINTLENYTPDEEKKPITDVFDLIFN